MSVQITPTGSGGTAFTVDSETLSATGFLKEKEVIQNEARLPVGFAEFEKNKKQQSGGTRIEVRISDNFHSDTVQFTGAGYDDISLDVRQILYPGWEQWFDAVRPVVISGHEDRVNRGPEKIVALWEERVENSHLGMRLEFVEQLFAGDQSRVSDMLSLNGIDNTDGLLEEDTVGNQSNEVHTLSKTTFASGYAWQNQLRDIINSASENAVDALYGLITDIRRKTRDFSKHRWYWTLALAGHMKKLVAPNEMYMKESDLDQGRRVMMFGGIPVEESMFLPTDGTTTTTYPMSALLLDHANVYWLENTGFWFKMGPVRERDQKDVQAAFIHSMGQLCARDLYTSGIAVRGETW